MRIYCRYLFSQFIFIFGGIWALVGTPFLAVGVVNYLSETEINRRGIDGQATLVEKIHTTGKNQSSNYALKYVFVDLEGRKHVRESRVNWETWRKFEDGQKIPIRYLPDQPRKSRLGGDLKEEWWIIPLVFGALGVIFGGVGWFLVVLAFKRAGRALDILRTGIILTGTVTELAPDYSTRINGRNPLVLRYRFRGPDGRDHEGKTGHLPRRLEDRWKAGSDITIVCDPANTERHEADLFGIRSSPQGSALSL